MNRSRQRLFVWLVATTFLSGLKTLHRSDFKFVTSIVGSVNSNVLSLRPPNYFDFGAVSYDRLSLIDAKRQGGGGKSERFFYDFSVNDRPFSEIAEPGDFIAPFGWLGTEPERMYFSQLLLRAPSELASGRVPLYICPECADLGCGCLTVLITKYADCFVWSEFGFENNYEDTLVESYPTIRDYAFNKTEYYNALNRFGFD